MARPRKPAPSLTPGQASYVLERLIADRRISSGDVSRYVGDMHREIRELETRLESLRAAGNGANVTRSTPRASAPRQRQRPTVTAERRASQQLQGRYLGLIRQIAKNRRAQYQKIAKERGREAAIKEMTAALSK
jgi:hypothetical protein